MSKCNKFTNKSDDEANRKISLNTCKWMCYARLDNRFKGYWMRQKKQLIERYKNKSYDSFILDLEKASS